jgi:hypothetical protein
MNSRSRTILLLLGLTALGLWARFARLDHLGFYGDEDTTA